MSSTLDQVLLPPAIEQDIEAAIRRAKECAGLVLLTQTVLLPFPPDPLAFLQQSAAELGHGVYWRQPQGVYLFVGAGSALEITAPGRDRFASTAQAVRSLRSDLIGDDSLLPFPIIGGFAFDPLARSSSVWSDFPNARLVVPQVLLQTLGAETYLRVTVAVTATATTDQVLSRLRALEAASQAWQGTSLTTDAAPRIVRQRSLPDRASWELSVAVAVDRIQHGEFDKVVLAREERLCADAPFAPVQILDRLRTLDPAATHFGMQSGQSWLLGATPERLVRLRQGRVDVTCLAGSIAIGSNPEEDRELAAALLASAKDREEHEIVVRSTMAALRDVCDEVTRQSGTPRVVPARSVQHLETPVSAQIADSGSILDLVGRLHPTPAVGGYPREAALDAIRELEQIDRGWYAAPFGWTDPDGSGEFVVAIRSALLTGRMASLFAGCGIVDGSVPRDEFAETELKLHSMLTALGTL